MRLCPLYVSLNSVLLTPSLSTCGDTRKRGQDKQARGSGAITRVSSTHSRLDAARYLWLGWSLQGGMHRLGVAIGKRLWSGRHWWLQYSACLLRLGFRGAVVSFPKSIFHLHQRIRRQNSVLVREKQIPEKAWQWTDSKEKFPVF